MNVVKNIVLVGLTLMLCLSLQSCKKTPQNSQTDFKKELAVIKEAKYPQQFANQFMLTFFKSIYDSTLLNTGLSKIDSAKVALNIPDSFDIKVEYWYENENLHWHHYDGYGHYRMGTIIYTMDNTFLTSDKGTCTIFPEKKFYYDSLPTNIENISIEKTGLSPAGNQTFKAIFNNIIMSGTYSGNPTRTFSAEFDYELFKDPSTSYSSNNDYFLFSGNIQGNTTSDYIFNITLDSVQDRYMIDYNCWYTIQGKSTVSISGADVPVNDILLNYIAEDGCSNYYEITFSNLFSTKNHIE